MRRNWGTRIRGKRRRPTLEHTLHFPQPQYDYSYGIERARKYWEAVNMRENWRLLMGGIDEGRSTEAKEGGASP